MDKYLLKDHVNKQSNKMDPKEMTKRYHKYTLIEQRTQRFSIPSCPLIDVKFRSHMKKKPGITQKIRNDGVDECFGRK